MTKKRKVTKIKAWMGPPTYAPGRVVKGAGGTVEMIEFSEYTPNVLAPDVLVDQVLGIYKVSASLVKCTFGLSTTTLGGVRETVERVSLMWEPHRMLKANEMFGWAFKEWQNGTFAGSIPDDAGGRRPRTQ